MAAGGRQKNRNTTANRVQNQAIRSAWQSEAGGSGKLTWPRE